MVVVCLKIISVFDNRGGELHSAKILGVTKTDCLEPYSCLPLTPAMCLSLAVQPLVPDPQHSINEIIAELGVIYSLGLKEKFYFQS